jgi:hypothetical protein
MKVDETRRSAYINPRHFGFPSSSMVERVTVNRETAFLLLVAMIAYRLQQRLDQDVTKSCASVLVSSDLL